MKKLLLLITMLGGYTALAQEDYILTIDGKPHTIAADKEYKINIKGKDVAVSLAVKDTLVYNDNMFSFEYLKDFKVSKVDLEGGIEQIMIMTAEGAGFMIQRYSGFNPQTLNELILGEVTKESLSYGYEMVRKNYKKKLASGQDINVSNAILTYNEDFNMYEVASIGVKDEGILIMTMMMTDEANGQGKAIIDLMWKTIKFKR